MDNKHCSWGKREDILIRGWSLCLNFSCLLFDTAECPQYAVTYLVSLLEHPRSICLACVLCVGGKLEQPVLKPVPTMWDGTDSTKKLNETRVLRAARTAEPRGSVALCHHSGAVSSRDGLEDSCAPPCGEPSHLNHSFAWPWQQSRSDSDSVDVSTLGRRPNRRIRRSAL